MIQANELRIGNYVLNDEGQWFRVNADFIVNLEKNKNWGSPILLTTKILKKFGFKSLIIDACEVYHKATNLTATFSNRVSFLQIQLPNKKLGFALDVELVWLDEPVHNQLFFKFENLYLHQLQNLYHSLSGRELQMGIFEEK